MPLRPTGQPFRSDPELDDNQGRWVGEGLDSFENLVVAQSPTPMAVRAFGARTPDRVSAMLATQAQRTSASPNTGSGSPTGGTMEKLALHVSEVEELLGSEEVEAVMS